MRCPHGTTLELDRLLSETIRRQSEKRLIALAYHISNAAKLCLVATGLRRVVDVHQEAVLADLLPVLSLDL